MHLKKITEKEEQKAQEEMEGLLNKSKNRRKESVHRRGKSTVCRKS